MMLVENLIPVTTIILFLYSPTIIEAQNTGGIGNHSVDYPFFAAVHWYPFRRNYSFNDVVCSAGILTPLKVLTTCSCILFLQDGNRDPNIFSVSPKNYYVSMGIGQTGAGSANISNATVKRAVAIEYHPSCSLDRKTRLWYGDLAYFTLENQIDFNAQIQPMPIPQMNMFKASHRLENLANNRSLSCMILAWSKSSPQLVALDVELLAMTDCVDHCTSYVIPMFCLIRDRVSGFMIKTAKPLEELKVFTGGPLVCNGTVWAMVNLQWPCSQGIYHQVTSPAEVIFATFDFKISIFQNNLALMPLGD